MLRGLPPIVVVGLLSLPSGAPGAAEDPEWPCVQRLVPELSPAMIWAGPPLGQTEAWDEDPVVRDLAPELAARRVPLDDAVARVAEVAQSLDPASRERTLTLLFAGVLEIIDRERRSIIAGIKRFATSQAGLGERIRTTNDELRQLTGGDAAAEEMRRQALRERRDWDIRIFDERQRSLPYLCEQPVLLEQRAFALGRAIAGELK
ncbi:MAG TPA: hypothetical protein VFZ01_05940 [Geminicoccaceae bacterium]